MNFSKTCRAQGGGREGDGKSIGSGMFIPVFTPGRSQDTPSATEEIRGGSVKNQMCGGKNVKFPPSPQKTQILEKHTHSSLKRRKVSLWMCLQEDRRQKTLSL